MRRPNFLPQPTGSAGYVNAIGRRWDVDVLDRLLGQPAVCEAVRSLYINAHCNTDNGRDFSPGVIWSWLKGEYRRDEVVALYLLLVARFRDLMPAPLSREGTP